MHYNHELSEYGLTIEAQHLNPVVCSGCRTRLKIWPGWDWIFCENCRVGASRAEIVKKTWRDAQPRTTVAILDEYLTKIVGRRLAAEKAWNILITGPEAELYGQRTGAMGTYLRWANSPQLLEPIEALSVATLDQVQLPAVVLRLEDLPGRLTGFLLVWQDPSGKGYLSQTVNIVPGPKVAFLEHVAPQQVAIKDPMLLMHIQTRHFAVHDKYIPVLYVDMRESFWKPRTGGNVILAVDRLLPKDIETIARSGCLLHVHDPLSTSSKLTLSNAEEWYQRVLREAEPWDMAMSSALAKLSDTEIAATLVVSKASRDCVEKITGRYRHERREAISEAIRNRPLEHRISKSKIVFDDGVSWTAADGSTVLSGSFRILSVQRNQNQKIVYFCRLTTESTEIDFMAGQELERNAFQVILREGLLQGVTVTFDRSYSRHAIEIATSLRPINPTD